MKNIRLGNDISVVWTVTAGSPVDLENVELTLFDQYGDKATISDVEVRVTGELVYKYLFSFYGKDQKRQGVYRVLLQRNEGEIGMVTLDKTDAFQLFGVCDFGIVEGEDEDHVETVTVELSSTISTSVEGEGFDPENYYTKDETNELLAERQRAFTSQDPLEMANNRLRLRMLAIGNDVKGFVGTQVFPEVSTDKDSIMPSIKAIEDHIVTPLQTAISDKQDTIQDLDEIRSGAEEGATAYQKPASGIPATDLASAVQTLLGKASTALQDAPADGQQYARKDHEWVPVEASGGGGSLTIVEVPSETTTISAEAGKYYRLDNTVTNLAITLPTISGATETKDIAFAFTTGDDPNVAFSASGEIKYYDGYKIEPNISHVVKCSWNGSVWNISAVATEPTIYSGNVTIRTDEHGEPTVYIQADGEGRTDYTKLTITQDGTNVDPTAMMSIENSSGIEWIRANSHRFLVKYAGEDGNGRARALVCQLHDANSNLYADGTAADLTGSEGDVMTRIAPFYWYCDSASGASTVELWVSRTPIIGDGAEHWDGSQMIGTYEARLVLKGASISDSKTQITVGTTTAPNSFGRSVCNTSANWQSTPTNANNRNIYYSDSTYNNTVLFLNKAMHNRGVGSDGQSGFCSVTWEQHCIIAMLYYLTHPENTNCQAVCGAGDNSYVRVLGSITNMLGMKDTNTSVGGATTANATATVSYNNVNFFGIENAWGGKTEVIGNAVVASNVAPALVQLTSPFDFNTSTRQIVGTSINAGYPRKLIFGRYFDILNAYATSADASTGYCDYQSLIGTGQAFPRAVSRSFNSANVNGGVAYVRTNNALTNANANLGGRLAFIGTITEAESAAAFRAAEDVTFG